MATNRDLLKEAIADAKAVKETAIANAKAALQEAFAPQVQALFAAKLQEIELEEDLEEMYGKSEDDKINEVEGFGDFDTKENTGFNQGMKEKALDETADNDEDDKMNELDLEELLRELEEEETAEGLYEAEEEEEEDMEMSDEESEEGEEEGEEMEIEDMSEEDLKSFIEDVIKDMVSAGELEAGHEGMEDEEGAEGEEERELEDDEEEINIDELLAEVDEAYAKKASDPSRSKNAIFSKGKDEYTTPGSQEKESPYSKGEARKVSFMDEELDELTAAQSGAGVSGDNAAIQAIAKALDKGIDWVKKNFNSEELKQAFKNIASASGGSTSTGTKESLELNEMVKTLNSELNESNLLNAKLLYTNKVFRNKSLTESQKIKVLTSFDKATSKKEVELVYETLQESLKVSTTKAPIKESLGSASKTLGGVTSKPIIENDAFSRMRELAFGKNK